MKKNMMNKGDKNLMWINNKWVDETKWGSDKDAIIDLSNEQFDDMIKKELGETVDHPKHYNREGGMECIDEMILVFGREAVKNFCLCNAWKYRYRAADKNGKEDLKKSDWYLKKYKEFCEAEVMWS